MSVLMPIAHGSESLETVTTVNILRRGGLAVTVASIEKTKAVRGTREITLTADTLFSRIKAQSFDLIVLPGGEQGAAALGAHAGLAAMLKAQRLAHRWIAAICAAPALVLAPQGLLDGKQATGYPAFRDALLHYVNQPVVVDGHSITSQGPATAPAFALKLVEVLAGEATARRVAEQILVA